MLTYEVNQREASTRIVTVDLDSYSIEDDINNEDQVILTCNQLDPDLTFTPGEELSIAVTYMNQDVNETYVYNFQDNHPVYTANNNYSYFTFFANKYFDLQCENMSLYADENGTVFLRFEFNGPHYFRAYDENITFYVTYVNNDGELYEQEFSGCEYVYTDTLDWEYDKTFPGIQEFMCHVFHNDRYDFTGYQPEDGIEYVELESVPDQPCFTDPVDIKVKVTVGCEERYEYYTKDCGDGDLNQLDFYRLNFFYDEQDQFVITVDRSYFDVVIPISQAFDVTTSREEFINEHLVDEETDRVINTSADMEKFVYHPVYITEGSSPSNFHTEPIYKIKFNLHFRKRDTDWKVIETDYWNGVDDNGQLYDYDGSGNNPFFSYKPTQDPQTYQMIDNRNKQSDLLSYLGFTNADVKYQKNKLKKSFLRLSYYDSPRVTSQNLIGYSTVFFDAGRAFGKMMDNGTKAPYHVSGDTNIGHFNTGIRVNSEPYGSLLIDQYGFPISNDDIEEMRISSQFCVEDKYFSTNCSEGFYLYLWADNDPLNIPTDLYMRVEFNHAGYGRTVPFMMPYKFFDEDTLPENKGIKTFQEIMTDWTSGNGYSFRDYLDYSHIHLKYRYDPDKNQRVYYLDDETYGNSVIYGLGQNGDESPNELELNLYEAKVQFANNLA